MNQDWEDRVAALWDRFDDYTETEGDEARFRADVDALVAELPEGSPLGPFEQACAWDSTGHSDKAVPLYREALGLGIADVSPYKARRTKIQLASSLRNIGQAAEGVKLLQAELDAPSDDLDDPVRFFLALCLSSLGRDREALSLALGALAPHMARYQRSAAYYTQTLVVPGEQPEG
ncbi:tetratricopeptide repeat protein [Streptomyces coeruleorubidus]|uniref:tetratricopeptide repeat protein n=1 Tax=Streptomyces coeruleorubidus TaxID=116188 RepID=UPI0033E806BA